MLSSFVTHVVLEHKYCNAAFSNISRLSLERGRTKHVDPLSTSNSTRVDAQVAHTFGTVPLRRAQLGSRLQLSPASILRRKCAALRWVW